jgi:hypothetical protein
MYIYFHLSADHHLVIFHPTQEYLHPPLQGGTFEALAILSPMVTQSQKECPEQAQVLCQESSHSCCRVPAFRSNEDLCVFLMRDISTHMYPFWTEDFE